MRIGIHVEFQTLSGKGTHLEFSGGTRWWFHKNAVSGWRFLLDLPASCRVRMLVSMLQLTTIVFLISFFVLAVIHSIASELYLYWHIFWFDIPMHFFGGAIVSLGFYTLRDLGLFPNKALRLIPLLLLVLLVALCWEGYEYFIGYPIWGEYAFDTIADLCMGVGGGAVGYFIGKSLRQLR